MWKKWLRISYGSYLAGHRHYIDRGYGKKKMKRQCCGYYDWYSWGQ